MEEESVTVVEKLKAELETQHQASINQLKALWSQEKETEIQLQVNSEVASAKAAWRMDLQKVWLPAITSPFSNLPNDDFFFFFCQT